METVLLEEYEYRYNIFLAEQELFEDMIDKCSISITNESFMIITESIKDTLLKYLTKIKNAIQKVWNSFKEKIGGAIDKKYLGIIKERVKTLEPNCKLTNFPVIKDIEFGELRLKELEYNKFKDHLDTAEHFISVEYPKLPKDTDPDTINAKVQKYCTELTEVMCDNKQLQEIYSYCVNGYAADIKIIEEDLKKVNQSQENIDRLAKTINESDIISIINYYKNYSILNEGPTDIEGKPAGSMGSDNKSQPADTKTETQKTDETDKSKVGFQQQKAEPETKEDKEKKEKLIKEIQIYMSGTCNILSAKMGVVKNKYKKYMDILHHFLPYNEKKEVENEKETNDKGETSQKYKVKI